MVVQRRISEHPAVSFAHGLGDEPIGDVETHCVGIGFGNEAWMSGSSRFATFSWWVAEHCRANSAGVSSPWAEWGWSGGVVAAPVLHDHPGFQQGVRAPRVEQYITQSAVERLDKGVLAGRADIDEK